MYDDQQSQENRARNSDEEIISSWDEKLKWFKDNIYPTFKPYGFTLPEAFSVFKMNQVQNEIQNLTIEKVDNEEEDEPWRKK